MQGKRRFQRVCLSFLIAICVWTGLFLPLNGPTAHAEQRLHVDAKSYILMEKESGRILAEKQADRSYPPASMTKIMTEYLVQEQVKKGKAHWNDKVTVSANAASVDEAQVNLVPGEKRTVRELFSAMAVYSANDAAVALAEHLAGSEARFVTWMNRKANEMGLKHTHFHNVTGLPVKSYQHPPKVKGGHYMSARDVAELTRRMLQDFPEVKKTTAMPELVFRPGEAREKKLTNINWMLPGLSHAYDGVDGVKTGYTRKAGYCFAGSAKRGNMRLITVVMGTSSKDKRFDETVKLMNYGFDHYQMKQVLSPGIPVPGHKTVHIKNALNTEVPVTVAQPLQLPLTSAESKKVSYHLSFNKNLEAPLSSGTVVGKAKILYDEKEMSGMKPIPVVLKKDAEEAGWLRLLFRRVWLAVS
ncbi:D-alanyl-D-alanine carboxypeptidase [Marinithermofilum abyssi]|uniref:serine-type D-Ala-D-Ala carboxypeptidase n=1 Tax=Marinithermofilum abyssi TaxID=1571185 RepID=A0A8J2VD79_9BACL|nr:D-alanyl-D-alanine carboxypeptidase family protein [Marinithermofilum abyssi]GGE06221.1 D-alanyl-D-alanine carboxypeptidase [Marinithermofilum abyssi]